MAKIYQIKVEGNTYEVEVEFVSETDSSMSSASVSAPTTPIPTPIATPSAIAITAPMQGNIWKVTKKVGDIVKLGDTVVILEAMKMENNIVAPQDGTISSILVSEGDAVDSGTVLAELA